MKNALITICFFALPTCVFGQATKRIVGTSKIDIEPYLRIGTQIAFLPNLKEELKSLNYSMPQRPWINIAGGVTMTINNGPGFGFDYSAAPSLNSMGSIRQIQGIISYRIINNEQLAIIPEMGFGKQFLTKVLDNTSTTNNFDSLVLTNGNSARLNTKGSFLSGSILVKLKNHRLSGIRIGYSFGINEQSWKSGDHPIMNSPVEKASSLYIQFNFGFL